VVTRQPNFDGEGARGAAQAAAHVEDAQARREAGQAGEAQGGILAAAVELIRGGEVVDGERVEILPRGGEGVEDGAAEALAGPVVADGGVGRRRHAEPAAV
jgi:hypothetical protein